MVFQRVNIYKRTKVDSTLMLLAICSSYQVEGENKKQREQKILKPSR